MPIKRSQSAPQPVEAVFSVTKVNTNDTATRADLRRTQSYLAQPSATNTPLIPPSPWVEREDPFSLAGFFPASHRATPEDEQWKWLRREEDDKVSVSSFSVDDEDSVLGELEEELADKTIKGEDKLGVLSLGKLSLDLALAWYNQLSGVCSYNVLERELRLRYRRPFTLALRRRRSGRSRVSLPLALCATPSQQSLTDSPKYRII
jgi:hypothetical protein